MPTYITLAEFTQQGIADVENSPELIDAIKKMADGADGELLDIYVTFGEYDTVMLSEFPDDESYAKFILNVARFGNMSTETLKAFTEEESRELTGDLGPLPPAGPAGEF